jgi:hypothetical protein
MKNLIEEIEKLKRPDTKVSFDEGFNRGLNLSQEVINQYNIITAPKSIKLSEMLDKICELYEEIIEQEIYFNREINCIGYGEYDEDWMQNTWHTFVAFNKDLTIKKINIRPQDNNIKWLYTLWIAGSEIIDDLEQ